MKLESNETWSESVTSGRRRSVISLSQVVDVTSHVARRDAVYLADRW